MAPMIGRRRRVAGIVLAALLGVGGCETAAEPDAGAIAASPAAAPSGAPGRAPRPAFADVSRGDTLSIVKLLALDPQARSAVVEPTLFMTGPEYCVAFGVTPGPDAPCEQDWITEDSRTKVTLPLADKARLAITRDNEQGCVGEADVVVGTCAVSGRQLARYLADREGLLMRLTTKDGTIVGMAELYTP